MPRNVDTTSEVQLRLDAFFEIHAVEASFGAPVEFHVAQMRVHREIGSHFLVGVEHNRGQAQRVCLAFSVSNQRFTDVLPRKRRFDSHVFEEHVVIAFEEHDEAYNLISPASHVNTSLGYLGAEISNHGRRFFADGHDVLLVRVFSASSNSQLVLRICFSNDHRCPPTSKLTQQRITV